MNVGVFTALLSQLPLEEVLKKLKAYQIETVELGTGNYPGDAHCKLSMLDNTAALTEFKNKLADHDASISALSCHGNALHPNADRARHAREISRKTILLAEKLGVSVVVDFSGCPGDGPNAKYPNWVTCPWPPDFLDILKWQWDDVVAPFWKEHAKFAADHGVKVAIEMHPGFVVYNPQTLLKLREAAGPAIGANFDPSHLFWQGIDPCAAVRALKGAIWHVHAKDTGIHEWNSRVNGVLDTKHYSDEAHRAWIFRTVGYGNPRRFWCDFVSTLRLIGYDGVLSMEHEDSLMTPKEGLEKGVLFLRGILLHEPKGEVTWA